MGLCVGPLWPQADLDTVGDFLLLLTELAAVFVRAAGPLQRQYGASKLIRRLFLCDPACTHFLRSYGAVAHVRAPPLL